MNRLNDWKWGPNLPDNQLQRLLLLLLLIGIILRFTNLSHQVYWHDETFTSLRASGYTAAEVKQHLFQGAIIGAEDLQKYQHPGPGKTLVDTVRSLAQEDAQHPPLYYSLVWVWVHLVGASFVRVRILSALLSLLVFPCMYWLCQELITASAPVTDRARANLISGIAIALIAVSPFHLLYAQEAREYGLWTGLILGSSAAFLRALRLRTWVSWGFYTAIASLGLYTQPFTLLILLGHLLYLCILFRFRLHRSLISAFLAVGAALITFIPWLQVMLNKESLIGAGWIAVPIPLETLMKIWGLHLQRGFLLPEGDFGFDHWLTYLTLPPLVFLLGYSFYYLCRQAPAQVWLLMVILTGSVALPLLLPDLIVGGQRSTASRYLVSFYLGIELAIAYFLTAKLVSPEKFQRKIGQGIAAILLLGSLFFCGLNTQANTAWTKGVNYNLPVLARILNAVPDTLVISNADGINFGSTLALSYLVGDNVRFQLREQLPTSSPIEIPTGFTDIFFFNPPVSLLQSLRQQSQPVNLVFSDYNLFLWRLGNASL